MPPREPHSSAGAILPLTFNSRPHESPTAGTVPANRKQPLHPLRKPQLRRVATELRLPFAPAPVAAAAATTVAKIELPLYKAGVHPPRGGDELVVGSLLGHLME